MVQWFSGVVREGTTIDTDVARVKGLYAPVRSTSNATQKHPRRSLKHRLFVRNPDPIMTQTLELIGLALVHKDNWHDKHENLIGGI